MVSAAHATHHWNLPSRMEEVRHLQSFLLELECITMLKADRLFFMQLALEECIVNAIKHGNNLDPTKQVQVHCDERPHELEFRVSDEGPGFDVECLPDPTAPDRLALPGGRGVFFIMQVADDAHYCNEAKEFIIRFHY